MVKMKPFFDAHFGCLKEKHHYWFGTLLLVRAFILLVSTLIPVSNMKIVAYSVSVAALALISFQTLCPPYSIAIVSKYETFFFIILAALGLTTFYTTTAQSQTVAMYVSIAIAFSQFLGLLTFKVYKIVKERTQLWKAFVEWLSSFKRRSVDDESMILDYNRETYELEAVFEMGSGDEEDVKTSEEPPTYGI